MKLYGGNFESKASGAMSSSDERRRKRQEKKEQKRQSVVEQSTASSKVEDTTDSRFAELLSRNEDDLVKFVAKINKLYQEKLKRPAPFMTFVFCGMQSAGKSTIMERFMNAVLNIVQEGTGTRCPLDTTCIHDETCDEPCCNLSGEELNEGLGGCNLSVHQVFKIITEHNKALGDADRFSTKPLYLEYKANNVQNMRFVDTPGIISNESTGKDNREDIKMILSSEMKRKNTNLCVLLEPKEFATNPIVDFCDQALGGRKNWIDKAVFMMTKFDKQLEDARTASKANNFFTEFQKNACFPHLVITPTLDKEDLPADKLFEERKKLLMYADEYESNKFTTWTNGHDAFRATDESEPSLDPSIAEKLGFDSAKTVMREIMLTDTAKRLPEVLESLRKELSSLEKEQKLLREKQRFNDPKEIKLVIMRILSAVERRIIKYLDGDLESSRKFPGMLQTLEDELEEEDDSDWASKELNHHSEFEDRWRDHIVDMEDYPVEIQANNKFLGGKQYQRALDFFRAVLIDSLPDPYQLKDYVSNGTGYLGGGLLRENWEGAMVGIIKVCNKEISHPGINFLIKHVGSIFRRLFSLALDDIKQGEEHSATFRLLPGSVEKYLITEFDKMLWKLMQDVAGKIHCALEPMYSTVDPNLPTFHADRFEDYRKSLEKYYVEDEDGSFVNAASKEEENEASLFAKFKNKLSTLLTGSGAAAKQLLKNENKERALSKKFFLPDKRTAMITSEEIDEILLRAFVYIVGLMEFNLYNLKFQLNHYLYEGFKNELRESFVLNLINNADWEALVKPDTTTARRLNELDVQIEGLNDSLGEVQRIQLKF